MSGSWEAAKNPTGRTRLPDVHRDTTMRAIKAVVKPHLVVETIQVVNEAATTLAELAGLHKNESPPRLTVGEACCVREWGGAAGKALSGAMTML